MEGAGVLPLAALIMVPLTLLKLLHGKPGTRDAALAEASHGAAMIVLPMLAMLRYGGILPAWLRLALLVLMIVGGFWLFNGTKFSVGWRDPKLIAIAALKIALAVLLFRAIDAGQVGEDFAAMPNPLLSFVGWWLLVTGVTKLLLLLRGFPAVPWDGEAPQFPHGKAPFANSADAAKGLSK